MASPVDTTVKFHLSTFSGAPVLSGTVGAMIGLLDAFLVDGYDTKTVTTLIVADGVATATFSAGHSSVVDTVVRIAGCTGGWTDLNGDQKVIARPGSTSLQFATALANGTATGTITLKMAPAGWTKVFSGTNKAVYQSADPGSTGMYLRVDDNGTRDCRVVGYEVMTDVDTGTAAFPTAEQTAGGGRWIKSQSANATATPYEFVCDQRFFAFSPTWAIQTDPSYTSAGVRGFGDCIPLSPAGDRYACALSFGRLDVGTQGTIENANRGDFSSCLTAAVTTATDGAIAMPRTHLNTGGSVFTVATAQHIGWTQLNGSATHVASGVSGWHGSFPSPVDGRLLLSPMHILTNTGLNPRAVIPGLYFLPQQGVAMWFSIGSVIPATGTLSGRKIVLINARQTAFGSAVFGRLAVDITGPWR